MLSPKQLAAKALNHTMLEALIDQKDRKLEPKKHLNPLSTARIFPDRPQKSAAAHRAWGCGRVLGLSLSRI